MKFFVAAILSFACVFALEPEFSFQPENEADNSNTEGLDGIFPDTIQEEEETNEPNNEAAEFEAENSIDTPSQVFKVQWDITPPEYSVKKKSVVKRGKVLDAIVLTKALRNAIVAAHNRARSITTPTSSNMRKMTWDYSLEKLATAYTRKCIYEHNPSPDHRRFTHVGENLFISMGLPYNKELLDHAVRAWDGEKTVYDYQTTKCQPGKVCGHYTQVVWAESFKVGCGVTRCGKISVRGKIWKNAILFGCNYGPGGNYHNEKPYKIGFKGCEKCDSNDQCKRKLCSNPIRDRVIFDSKMVKWSPWSEWSPCSSCCGMGNKRRDRTCNTFVPTDCKGFANEVKFCMEKPCQQSSYKPFKFNIILNEGDNFMQASLADLLKGKGNLFKRMTG